MENHIFLFGVPKKLDIVLLSMWQDSTLHILGTTSKYDRNSLFVKQDFFLHAGNIHELSRINEKLLKNHVHLSGIYYSNKEFSIAHTHGKIEKSYWPEWESNPRPSGSIPTQVNMIFQSFHECVRWKILC